MIPPKVMMVQSLALQKRKTALDLYSHLFSNMQEDAAAGLGKMLFDNDDD
jgi:hypothetical protein